MVCEPDAVVGAVEGEAIVVHGCGCNLKDDGATVATANGFCGVWGGGEVDMVAGHLFQAFCQDR